jgi:DNA-binding transcriptional ArsR family regulator
MIEKLVNSKTRLKILKLFLSNIDDRYYLRELERLLDESLSPLRRQLVKLTNIGILITEVEANLKYYRLNKDFEGLEELRRMVLGKDEVASAPTASRNDAVSNLTQLTLSEVSTWRRPRFDLLVLSFISVFVLITAVFVVYANNKNIKQVASLINRSNNTSSAKLAKVRSTTPASNGEMASRKWKVIPGNIPVLSSGETGGGKNSKEL